MRYVLFVLMLLLLFPLTLSSNVKVIQPLVKEKISIWKGVEPKVNVTNVTNDFADSIKSRVNLWKGVSLKPSASLGVILPAYFTDRSLWREVANHSLYINFLTIINPNSGPLPYSPAYDSYTALMKSHNSTVLGYVPTGYGSRPLSEVMDDVREYFSLYEVDGIFLDEVSDDESYYSPLVSQIRSEFPDAFIVGNPGRDVSDEVVSLFNLTIVFENTCSDYLSATIRTYPKPVAVLCYGLDSSEMPAIVSKALSDGISFIYMTSDSLPNPWDSYDSSSVSYLISRFSHSVSLPSFNVSGGVVYSNGKAIPLLGVNWFGFETDTRVVHGLWVRNYREMINHMKRLGFNAMRLPFCTHSVDPDEMPNSIDYTINPELKNDSSLVVMHKIVTEAQRQGIYVLLDYHRIGCEEIEEVWYNDTFSEDNYSEVWEWVAENFKTYPNVIGADLKNEPHGRARWGSGDLSVDWNKASQRIAKRVMSVAPGWLMFVEGTQFSNDIDDSEALYGYHNFWGENLQAVDRFPLSDIPKEKLVLSPHVYGPDVYVQPYFDYLEGFPFILPYVWDAHWGYLRDNYTLAIGEFGGKYGEGDPRDVIWQNWFVDYLIKKDICNVFYWSWNPNSGDTGGILDNDWTSVKWGKVNNLYRLFSYCRQEYCILNSKNWWERQKCYVQ